MFTEAKVKAISDHAKAISGGAFGLQAVGGDIGHGTRYIDGRRDTVWTGRRGSREAASYYFGVIDALTLGDVDGLPAPVAAIREELQGDGWDEDQYTRGYSDVGAARRMGRI